MLQGIISLRFNNSVNLPFETRGWHIYLPICTWPPSLSPPSIHIQIFLPHSRTFCRSGFLPKTALYGIIPLTALVVIQFINQMTWWAASPHKNFGRLLACRRAWICLTIMRFHCSVTPLCAGVLCTVSFCSVPLCLRCRVNALSRYSPPQLEWRTLIGTPSCQSHHASYSLYESKASDLAWRR